jgi:hypothetical protein
MYDNMMNNFFWRELANPDSYYPEDYRQFALNHRSSFNTLARNLINEGDIERAREVLNRSLEVIPDITIPYDYVSSQSLPLLFEVGAEEQALEMAQLLGDRADEMLDYMAESKTRGQDFEVQKQLIILNGVSQSLMRSGQTELGQKYEEMLTRHYNRLNRL